MIPRVPKGIVLLGTNRAHRTRNRRSNDANLRDNREAHDKEPFVPFGRVIEGMEIADALFDEYGEAAGGGVRACDRHSLIARHGIPPRRALDVMVTGCGTLP